MTESISTRPENSNKNLLGALIILATIIGLTILLSWSFSPPPLLFSENFENAERNQQYLPCAAFTIEQGRLRVTVAESHSGCAVQLPYEYEEFTLATSVYPVADVHDGSFNIIFGQADGRAYEVQCRPKEEQVNVIGTITNANGEKVTSFTSGWLDYSGFPFTDSENKVKLIVTRRSFDLWINGSQALRYMSVADNYYLNGKISIGSGAGEVGGIAFEFDNIEIRNQRSSSRWLHDYWIIKELEENESKINMKNGMYPNFNLPHISFKD